MTCCAKGQPVFVDFTAAWCLSCKVNERVALGHGCGEAGLHATKNVVLFRADWTHSDPAISKTLQQFNRDGVPLYLLYSPKSKDAPQVLPEVLTPGIVLDALNKLYEEEWRKIQGESSELRRQAHYQALRRAVTWERRGRLEVSVQRGTRFLMRLPGTKVPGYLRWSRWDREGRSAMESPQQVRSQAPAEGSKLGNEGIGLIRPIRLIGRVGLSVSPGLGRTA